MIATITFYTVQLTDIDSMKLQMTYLFHISMLQLSCILCEPKNTTRTVGQRSQLQIGMAFMLYSNYG